jgi:hypothetical protein
VPVPRSALLDDELEKHLVLYLGKYGTCRSQCPCGLRCVFAAARLLGLWVRIPAGHGCLSLVSIVCCQVEVSVTGRSLFQNSRTECGVSKWVWSWSLDNEEAQARSWAEAPEKKKRYLQSWCYESQPNTPYIRRRCKLENKHLNSSDG